MHEAPRFVLAEDPELPMSVALVEFIRKKPPEITTVAQYEQYCRERLFLKCMNNRLFKMAMRPENKTLYQATVSMSSAVPALEGAQLSIAPAEGRVCEAMFDSMIEIERARRFGFHDSEIF